MTTLTMSIGTRRRHNWTPSLLDILSLAFVVVVSLCAVLAPLLAPHDPSHQDLLNVYASPSSSHPLGTDDLGRDTLSRPIHGPRSSLLGPLIVVTIAVLVGTALAVVSAWYRGVVDRLIGRLVDLLLAFPGILLAALAAALFGPGLLTVSVALAIAYLPVITRVTRSAALRERVKPYIAACSVAGMSTVRICLRHIAPNVVPVVAAQSTALFGYAIVDIAALSFLGFGVQPPDPDWGLMVNIQSAVLSGLYTVPLLAGAVIVLSVLAIGRLGSRLEGQRG